MGHGEHEFKFPEIPDFRKYNVEDVPCLMETKRRLASRGLSDPWLRNEVWKYQADSYASPPISVLGPTFFRGFKYGVVIALVATAISKTFARKGEHH